MRVLIFSDHHGHAWKPYSKVLPSGMNSRLKDSIDVLAQIRQVAKQEKVDVILFCGDLFHARGSIVIQTFNAIFEEIAKMAIHYTVGLLVGNHDQQSRNGDVHSVYAMQSIVTVMDKPGWYPFEPKGQKQIAPLQVFALPYHPVKDDLVSQVEGGLLKHPGQLVPTALVGHCGVDGAKAGGNFILVDKLIPTGGELQFHRFDQCFMGHYHEPQRLAQNARYVGATHHHNWGDVGSERGCWLWDTAENQPYSDPTFRALNCPRFRVLDRSELGPQSWPDVRESYVRIKHNGINLQDQVKLEIELLQLGARTVEWVQESLNHAQTLTATPMFHPGMDFEEMVAAYVNEVPHNLDDEYLITLGQTIMKEVSK